MVSHYYSSDCSIISTFLDKGMTASHSSATLFPVREVNICPGGTRVFTCQVSTATTSGPVFPQINWWIQFETPSLSDVLQSYVTGDLLGDVATDYRSGYIFTFNLTSNNASYLESTLAVSLDKYATILFGSAIVDCNQANVSTTLRITTGRSTYEQLINNTQDNSVLLVLSLLPLV